MNDSNNNYKSVRGLSRGMALLNALNRFDGGAKILQLSQYTGLHRTTVRRLIETLQEEGYVRRSESDDSYQLTLKVRELSEGFRDEEWILKLAAPLLGPLMQEVVWPTDLCTLDVNAMVIRETTHRFSRLSFHRSMVGKRLPPLLTATGRAYLANCPDAERVSIIKLLAAGDGYQAELAQDAAYVDKVLNQTRKRGYGENHKEWESERKIAAIALPIHGEKHIMGCLSLVYIAQAMTIEDAVGKYFTVMKKVVEEIESRIAKI